MTKAEHRPAKGPGGGMKTPEPNARQPRGLTAVDVVLRALAAAALAVDAGVHARLADGYQSAAPKGSERATCSWPRPQAPPWPGSSS